MSDEQIRDEVLTIFLAGYETVANALTWTWYLLSQNPEVESKLHAELDHRARQPEHTRLPTLADYPNLHYTEQVFAESMRLYPPAWAMGRMSTRAITLGPYRIPPGAHFFFSQYIMGRTANTSPTRSASTPTASPRSQSRPPQIHLLPLRRRQPPVHRRSLRLDGGRLLHRHHRPALAHDATSAPLRPSRRPRSPSAPATPCSCNSSRAKHPDVNSFDIAHGHC